MDTPEIKLEDCKLITNEEYMTLKNSRFMGQTRLIIEGEDRHYYMTWESEGILYKTKNRL